MRWGNKKIEATHAKKIQFKVMDSAIVDSNKMEGKRYGDFSRGQGGGPPKRRRGPLGIDAFDQWRTRRSMRGSSAASDISEDISSLLSDVVDPETVDDQPGPSSASDPLSDEMVAMKMRDKEMQPMDTHDTLIENLDAVMRGRESEQTQKMQRPVKKQKVSAAVEKLSAEEIMNRKVKIGAIVRKPANREL